jgi:hypothetical protein
MLGGTWIFIDYYRNLPSGWDSGSAVKYLIIQFNLATENVLATWYSSMLLLLISVMAVLCFVADRSFPRSDKFRYSNLGWLLLSVLFAGLSLDELGSLHERIGMLTILNPFGDYALGWIDLFALPIAFVAFFMLAFGWIHIRRSRGAFVFLIVGITLFLSIPLQERIEMILWNSAPGGKQAWLRPIHHILLEEGAELFGSLCFLNTMAIYLISVIKRHARLTNSTELNLRLVLANKTAILIVISIIGLLAMGMIGVHFVMNYAPPVDKGIAPNWFPSSLAWIAATMCFLIWDDASENRRFGKSAYFIGGIFCLITSIYYGANMRGWLSLERLGLLIRLFVDGSLIAIALALSVMLSRNVKKWWNRISTVSWVLLLCIAMSFGRSYAGLMDFAALAVLLTTLVMHLPSQQ